MENGQTVKSFFQDLQEKLDNNSNYYAPQVKGPRWIWVGTKDKLIGNEECHYEIQIIKSFVFVDVHFEGNHAIDFLNLEPTYHYDWSRNGNNHQAIRFNKQGYEITNPKLIEMVFKELDKYEAKIGVKIRTMLKENEIYDQLKANHNIVLTGAPGTGKTFLAKEIATKLINERKNNNIILEPIEILKNAINNFKSDEQLKKQDEQLLKEFKDTFPKSDLTKLSLDNYCLGTGEQGGFCWFIEKKLKNQGLFYPGPRGAYVYGIYKTKNGEDYKYKTTLNKVNTDEERLSTVLTSIKKCIDNKNNLEILNEEYEKKYWDAGFILKVLYSYFPNEFIPINSKSHLINIANLFNLQYEKNATSFELQKKLFDFYKDLISKSDKKIKPIDFMRILYENFNIKEGEVKESDSIDNINLTGKWKLVQFHQSYDYTDFVEGLRPVPVDTENKDLQNDSTKFERVNGVFKDFCDTAVNNPNKDYVFIIDEINRGEVSKIFGELFFCIDPGYRGKKGQIQTQYQNLIEENSDDSFREGFYVPENVYIIGTMNDIDRSVDSLDFAFRRRFNWIPITAKESQGMFENADAWTYNIDKSGVPDNISDIKNRMDNLNNEIINPKYELSEDYQIGAAYFLKYTTYLKGTTDDDKEQAFESLWKYNIQPLLREYLRGTGFTSNDMKKAYDNNNSIN